jgi:hypothetical protein
VTAGIFIVSFNDGTAGGAGDRTGDHFATVYAARNTETGALLKAEAFLGRCGDAACNTFSKLGPTLVLTTALAVATPFTLRLRWDPAGDRFFARVNADSEVTLSYSGVSDSVSASAFARRPVTARPVPASRTSRRPSSR